MESKGSTLDEPATLKKEDLPAIYQAANDNSVEAQRKFLTRSWTGLVMIVIAAGAGALVGEKWIIREEWVINPLDEGDLMGVVAAAAFALAMLVRVYLLTERPERTWYGGRAAAESAKTLAWRYSVGGKPFGIDRDPDEVDVALIEGLREILTDLDVGILTMPSGKWKQITQGMRELRARSLEERKEAYRIGRIEDQLDWYSRKAMWNKTRFELWNICLISIEALGLIAAILAAIGLLPIDLLGFFGAVVAAGASWLQMKQHSNLAEAYSVAAYELSTINDRIPSYKTEESWAQFVNESETAISREHTLWRASSTTK